MRKLTWFLAATTLMSGSAMVYFARALHAERAGPLSSFAAARQPGGPDGLPGVVRAIERTERTSAADATTPTAEQGDDNESAARRAVARYRLERHRDPTVRARQIAEMTRMERRFLEGAAKEVGITKEEIDVLAKSTAERQFDGGLRYEECEADPACDPRSLADLPLRIMREEYGRILGAARLKRIERLLENPEEKHFLKELGDTLPARDALSTEAIEQLGLAMSQERERFHTEAERRGEEVGEYISYAQSSGPLFRLSTAARPGTADESAKRLASARVFAGRLEERASGHLDARQMAGFKAAMKRSLAAYEKEVVEEGIAAAARRAAKQP